MVIIFTRAFRKRFLDVNANIRNDSYWIDTCGNQNVHYDKMYEEIGIYVEICNCCRVFRIFEK